jgi:outer membrane protein TolC
MRLLLGLCALASLSGAAHAQAPTDSLRLSRRQAIAEALTRNAQIEISREQIAEARARRVTAIAVPDPTLSAAFDQAPGPFTFGTAGSRPVALGLDIPFPDKFRLNNRIGLADIGNSVANARLQQQTIALQASSTYDSLLVSLKHRGNLTEARDLANDFLKRTQIRYDAGTAFRRRSPSRRRRTI